MRKIQRNLNRENTFQRKTGIFIKILVPLLFLGLPVIILSYSDFLAKVLLPYLPEKTLQKLPLIMTDVEFQTRFILVLTFVLALFLGTLISWHFSRILRKISGGLKKILAGNLDFKIKIKDRDEIGEITHFLNKIIENLKEAQLKLKIREEEVKEKTLELSKKIRDIEFSRGAIEESRLATLNILEDVEEARLDLQERLDELEKFNKLAVGRELRMVELKEEIKKLQDELDKQKIPFNKKNKNYL